MSPSFAEPPAEPPSARIDMQHAVPSATSSSNSSRYADAKRQPQRHKKDVFRSCSAVPEYFTRVLDGRQMDFDAAFYQIVTLCVQPAKVYKSAYYRKQTKNRWARDDPAFAVIQCGFLLVATVAWAIAFRVDSVARYALLLLHAVLIEWLGLGLLIATLGWWLANSTLRQKHK